MKDDRVAGHTRRQWRDQHRPPIRRSDPILDLASWVFPAAPVVMFFAGTGISKRGPVPADVSAVFVIGCAVVIVLALVVVTLRLRVRSGNAPYSRVGAILLAVASFISPFVLWLRSGAITELVLIAFIASAVLLVFVGVSFVMWRTRSSSSAPEEPTRTAPE